MTTVRLVTVILVGSLVVACRRTPAPEATATLDGSAAIGSSLGARPADRPTLTLAGVAIVIELPPGVGMSGEAHLLGDAGFAPQTLTEGVVLLEPLGRQVGVPDHTRAWTLDVTKPGAAPASLTAAKALALKPDPRSPAQTLLGAEALASGGFLVSTRSADRIFVTSWHANGTRHVECTGEDLREDPVGPSWLDDPTQLQAALAALEAPCRSVRVLP